MMRSTFLLAASLLALPAAAARAQTSGPAVEVAPKAEGTRSQTWASAAWAADSKMWLVAWREGYLNDPDADIWCGRVSADGKALDPAGIRLTKGPGAKDRPRVASDGKSWLVVWQDLRNGKDFDVYATRVSAGGKPLDEGGVLLAGNPSTSSGPNAVSPSNGEGNQARPDVAFAKGNYYVVWQSFDKGYSVLGSRVSPEGKTLDGKGVEIVAFAKRPDCQAYNAVVCASGDELLVAGLNEPLHGPRITFRRPIDAATGQPGGKLPAPASNSNKERPWVSSESQRLPALALGGGAALIAVAGDHTCAAKVYRYDKAGELAGDDKGLAVGAVAASGHTPRYGFVFDGKNFLLAADHVAGGRANEKGQPRMEIRGWRLAPDGKIDGDAKSGFVIAADPGKDQTLPSLAVGPDGACLAVYSEVRGIDDVKVLARIVK